jgi:integrase
VHRAKNLGYVRLGGRMVYLGRAGTPEGHERYRRVVAEWLATGWLSAGRQPEGVTVAAVVEAYLRWARTYYLGADGQPSPGLGPVEAAGKALCSLYGSTAAASFGPIALKAVRQAMIDSGLCRNVVNQRVACVKRIFRWAVAEELVPPSIVTALAAVEPLRRTRSGVRETPPVRPVSDEHVQAVLPFLPPTLRAMVQLQRLTGMRSGELCVLRTCDVDTIGDVWLYRPHCHKTAYRGLDRVVRIGPQGQAILRPFLRPDFSDTYVFSPTAAQRERAMKRAVSAPGTAPRRRNVARKTREQLNRRYNPRSYRRALSYAMRTAAATGLLSREHYWHPHQLRHRHATHVRQVHGLEAARVLLGHRSVDQTLEYAEADSRFAIAIARELG